MGASVTIRDLRNHGGDVLARVERGEHLLVTRDGRPVAELFPVRSGGIAAEVLVARWRHVPAIDVAGLRADLDTVLDTSL